MPSIQRIFSPVRPSILAVDRETGEVVWEANHEESVSQGQRSDGWVAWTGSKVVGVQTTNGSVGTVDFWGLSNKLITPSTTIIEGESDQMNFGQFDTFDRVTKYYDSVNDRIQVGRYEFDPSDGTIDRELTLSVQYGSWNGYGFDYEQFVFGAPSYVNLAHWDEASESITYESDPADNFGHTYHPYNHGFNHDGSSYYGGQLDEGANEFGVALAARSDFSVGSFDAIFSGLDVNYGYTITGHYDNGTFLWIAEANGFNLTREQRIGTYTGTGIDWSLDSINAGSKITGPTAVCSTWSFWGQSAFESTGSLKWELDDPTGSVQASVAYITDDESMVIVSQYDLDGIKVCAALDEADGSVVWALNHNSQNLSLGQNEIVYSIAEDASQDLLFLGRAGSVGLTYR